MKRTGKWIFKIFIKAFVLILVLFLLPFAFHFINSLWANTQGEINVQSRILEQKLLSSQRLEVTSVDEEGIMNTDTSVIILGTVGRTTIKYRYTASIGIDLRKVVLTPDSDRIIFSLPAPEILNDGIEALEVNRHNLFSRAIDKSVESLMNEQRLKCRDNYLNADEHRSRIWSDTQKAFEETICKWLEGYGERHYSFEYVTQTNTL